MAQNAVPFLHMIYIIWLTNFFPLYEFLLIYTIAQLLPSGTELNISSLSDESEPDYFFLYLFGFPVKILSCQ